ncbi:MAG: molybdate ABC transporter permease subunit [Halieaceae bacterium]|jgi:molybdate transport system permease protein|nr:molybdate ABC transporter permease subunit [Halieaceae bacterium]
MSSDWEAVALTAQLAAVTTLLLLLIGSPVAWWLARSKHPMKPLVEAVVALPLVLPPTVLGFYLLVFLNPDSVLGSLWLQLTDETLTFSFAGLVVASLVYSLPFMVQPLQTAFAAIGDDFLEAAATMRASPVDRFFSLVLPLTRRGYLAAATLTFAHTVGEFGVVLMIGGNIPGETRVLSIAIFEHVEMVNYPAAHSLSLGLLLFSFVVLAVVYGLNRRPVAGIR